MKTLAITIVPNLHVDSGHHQRYEGPPPTAAEVGVHMGFMIFAAACLWGFICRKARQQVARKKKEREERSK